MSRQVVLSGGFDDLRSRHLRLVQEASKLGEVMVLLWPDDALERLTGRAPKFPLTARLYMLNAVRFVHRALPLAELGEPNSLPELKDFQPQVWVDEETAANAARAAFCRTRGLE